MNNSNVTKEKIISGNFFDKYNSRNPIVKYLMQGFYESIFKLIQLIKAEDIHEVGCGEGYLTSFIQNITTSTIRGSDYSESIIKKAKLNNPCIKFEVKSIYDLSKEKDSADLIICCEVLEHLDRPQDALQVLHTITSEYCMLSVPREPIWRILNMLRGKYITSSGNTPGHIQHWSKMSFLKMVEKYFDIIEVKTPLPWTIVLCKKR